MLGAVMHDIRVGKGLEIEAVESVVEDLVESIIRHPGALQLVSRMREADESSYTHALQVAVLLASFGRELGYSREQLTYLGQVGMLLDVREKLRIDEHILNKSGNLTPAEFEEVKRHVQYGLEIVESSAVAHPDVIAGVAQHHERLNASGYPRGLHDAQISPIGKMAGIVDSFAALTSSRPYAQPVSPYAAMQQLQGVGQHLLQCRSRGTVHPGHRYFPVGTLVELSTGEFAVVLEQGRARRLKPKVLVVSAPDKTPVEVPFVLDLLHGEGAPGIRCRISAKVCQRPRLRSIPPNTTSRAPKPVAARMAGWILPKRQRRSGERQILRSHLVPAVAETIAKARSAKRCVAVVMLRLKPKDRLSLFTQEHIGAQAEQEFVQLAQLLRPADRYCIVDTLQVCMVLPDLATAAQATLAAHKLSRAIAHASALAGADRGTRSDRHCLLSGSCRGRRDLAAVRRYRSHPGRAKRRRHLVVRRTVPDGAAEALPIAHAEALEILRSNAFTLAYQPQLDLASLARKSAEQTRRPAWTMSTSAEPVIGDPAGRTGTPYS